jgi:hypothetical protein
MMLMRAYCIDNGIIEACMHFYSIIFKHHSSLMMA